MTMQAIPNQKLLKKRLCALTIITSTLFSQVPIGYYDQAKGKSGQELKKNLNKIISSQTSFPYTSSNIDTWDILKKSDADPKNADNIILIYTGYSVNAEQEYNNAQGWSREHVWAKSRGDFGNSFGIGTDVHNLKPSDISINSTRGNKDFDNGGNIVIDKSPAVGYSGNTECKSNGSTWEPPDNVKGDIARIMFYMSTRYEGSQGDPDLEIVNDIFTVSSKLPKHGVLEALMDWHSFDPVDEFERNRNDVIYSYQKNRNPFIDHPEFVDSIWGSGKTIVDSATIILPKKFTIEKIYPNPFNAKIGIKINVIESIRLKISLFDTNGRKIEEYNLGSLNKGGFDFIWRPKKLSSGIYIIHFDDNNSMLSKKITFLK